MQLFKNTSILISFFTILSVFAALPLLAQYKQLNYKVMQGSNNIGWVKVDKRDSANTSIFKLGSEIKKRVLFLFTIKESRETHFTNGLMLSSYVFRSVNKDVKVDMRTFYEGTQYKVKKEKAANALPINRIDCNFLSLYFQEPVNMKQAYCDTYEKMLNIEKTAGGPYKIIMPDGSITSYYYTNGICSKVKVEQSLFTIEFVLI